MSAHLFHLLESSSWPATGTELRPASLSDEGFVHCSFAEQLAGTANRYYRTVAALCALELDPELVHAPIRVEDSYGSGTAFPHVYGTVPTAAVVAVHELDRDAAGDWRFSPDAAGATASPDR